MKDSPWNFGKPTFRGLYFVNLPSPIPGDNQRLYFSALWNGKGWEGLPPAWSEAVTQWMVIPEPLPEGANLNASN